MKIKLLRDGPEKTFAVLLGQGDEPVSALLQFARDPKIPRLISPLAAASNA